MVGGFSFWFLEWFLGPRATGRFPHTRLQPLGCNQGRGRLAVNRLPDSASQAALGIPPIFSSFVRSTAWHTLGLCSYRDSQHGRPIVFPRPLSGQARKPLGASVRLCAHDVRPFSSTVLSSCASICLLLLLYSTPCHALNPARNKRPSSYLQLACIYTSYEVTPPGTAMYALTNTYAVSGAPTAFLAMPTTISRKRSPLAAFAADATPPHSRPPSRTHTKRARRPDLSERPAFVHARDAAINLHARIPAPAAAGAYTVQVVSPALPTFPPTSSFSSSLAASLPPRDVPLAGLVRGAGRETAVLCFLGSGVGVRTLAALAEVRGVLAGVGAGVWGVALAAEALPAGAAAGVDVVWDVRAVLTKALGLLHPLGGGRAPLDAVVVVDEEGRARMVLPVGWAGRGADGETCVLRNVVARVVRGVEWLGEEKKAAEWAERMEVEMSG